MSDATIGRITDRYALLIGQGDRRFVLQLETYIDALESERRVRRILKKLREDSEEALTSFAQSDRELVAELVSIRNRLAADAPNVDVAADPPEPRDPLGRREWIMETLSGFDLVAAGDDEIGFSPMPYYSTANPGRTQELVQILRGRLHVAEWGAQFGRGPQPAQKLRDDLAHYGIEIENVQARYGAVKRRFKQQELMLPGLAEERLRLFVKSLNPEPFLVDPNEDEDVFMERAFRHVLDEMGDRGILRRAAEGQQLTQEEQQSFDRVAQFLREEVERLHAELVDRLRLQQRSVSGQLTRKVKGVPVWAAGAAGAALIGTGALAAASYAGHWFTDHSPDKPATTGRFFEYFDMKANDPSIPRLIGDRAVITRGEDWAFVAWRSTRGLCTSLVFPEKEGGTSCGMPVVGASREKGGPEHLVVGGTYQGRPNDDLWFEGVAAANVSRIEVELTHGRRLQAFVYDAPAALGLDLKFFLVRTRPPEDGAPKVGIPEPPLRAFRAYDAHGRLLERFGPAAAQ